MDEFGVIQDYSMIDAFISQNLADFNRKLFGSRDEETGYFDEVDTEKVDDEQEMTSQLIDEQNAEETNDSGPESMSNEDIYNYLFGEFDNPQRNAQPPQSDFDYTGEDIGGPYEPQQGGVQFKENVSSAGLSPTATNVINDLSKVAGNFVVTSGKRSHAQNSKLTGSAKNSFHLTGQAVDIRPNSQIDSFLSSDEGKQFMAQRGYEIIDERRKKGVGPHWHLEPAGRKQAGGTPVAHTQQEQYEGLNNDELDTIFMPLQGTNPIRGLDNGQPVYVRDDSGQEKVLYGPDDIAYMTGGIYEKRLSKKYKTK